MLSSESRIIYVDIKNNVINRRLEIRIDARDVENSISRAARPYESQHCKSISLVKSTELHLMMNVQFSFSNLCAFESGLQLHSSSQQ